eukprot:26052-Chlamydomonas_euryale.AAC.3
MFLFLPGVKLPFMRPPVPAISTISAISAISAISTPILSRQLPSCCVHLCDVSAPPCRIHRAAVAFLSLLLCLPRLCRIHRPHVASHPSSCRSRPARAASTAFMPYPSLTCRIRRPPIVPNLSQSADRSNPSTLHPSLSVTGGDAH